MMKEFEQSIMKVLALALREDIGNSDITSTAILPESLHLKGYIFAKEDGCAAGLGVLELFFTQFYKDIDLNFLCKDGEHLTKGQRVLEIEGPGRSLLSTERLTLNILQRMSGIATETNRYVERIRGTSATILDTRKTAPGLRALDKLAVRLGGGTNHRMGLFDSYLIKENHIEAAGGLSEAVRRVRSHNTKKRMIEVEVRSIGEFNEALGQHVDRILLDNMSIEQMKTAVELSGGKVPLEASGNITLDNVRQVAETGVDFISVGSLTHSVRALDLSLIIEKP
jgi:nicotinate-nucleotide pyrophosphorylase (carboxylating)